MSQTIPLLLDGIVIVLLLATIVTASILSSRLKILKDSRKDFQEMITKFDQATARADAGVKSLLANAGKAGDDLQVRLDRARLLRDELSMMIQSADSLAQRLETASGAQRRSDAVPVGAAAASSGSARTIPEPPSLAPDPRSKAERDLLKALGRKDGSS